ncbi:hypothetical protein KQX54_019681 [Cotesia glomerata]|uniref:Uncharacterized protein n=1 Tax=Cotesia glomerata TaxID=32391 RepID=A0AAV7I691_COTGL|nr:hypothetical protein KQX54_019681 [Cotesia glomerata]
MWHLAELSECTIEDGLYSRSYTLDTILESREHRSNIFMTIARVKGRDESVSECPMSCVLTRTLHYCSVLILPEGILCTDDVLLVIYLNLSFNLYSLFSLFRADIWWLGAGGSGLKRNKKLKGREQEKCTEEVCSDSFLETGNTLGNKVKTSFTLIYLFIRFRLGHQLDSFRDIGTAFLRYTNYWVISFLFSTSRY